jgi:hypothetical protein
VGIGRGWVKLNVLQKLWIVFRLAALLILQSVGIFFFVFLSLYCRVVGCPTLACNGLRVGDVALCCACGKAILLTRC